MSMSVSSTVILHSIFLRQSLSPSLNLELVDLVRMASPRDAPFSAQQCWVTDIHCCTQVFLHGCWVSNSSSDACGVSTYVSQLHSSQVLGCL